MSTDRWVIEVPEPLWTAHGAALLWDIAQLGANAARWDAFDVWNPAHPRTDIMPNLRVDGRTRRVTLVDLGGHDGKLLVAIDAILARFNAAHGAGLSRVSEKDPAA